MDISRFIQASGFKVLAMAKFTQCEYSLVLYLINCAVSGMDEIITTEAELASLIGYTEKDLSEACVQLHHLAVIKLRYSVRKTTSKEHPSIRIGFQFDLTRWQMDLDEKADIQDAIVYPFRRAGHHAALKVLEGSKKLERKPSSESMETWSRVLNAYTNGRSLDPNEMEEAEISAKVLIETHPVDQVLLLIRHFSSRIPSLSLLASSWQHYNELFENEIEKVDLLEARHKHQELDEGLRHQAREWLDYHEEKGLKEDEIAVLDIITKHRHPRRQLFWAYQLRSRYPNLEDFFKENAALMISVTTKGAVVKKSRFLRPDKP